MASFEMRTVGSTARAATTSSAASSSSSSHSFATARQSSCHLAAIATPSTRCSRSSGASADTTIANRSSKGSRTSPSSGLNVAKTRGAHACDAETPSRSTLFSPAADDGEDEIGHRVVHQVEFVEVQNASVRAREESRGEDGRAATHGRLDVDASGDGVFGGG